MTNEQINTLVNLLKDLDNAIPKDEGAVSIQLYSDGSGRINLEMLGVLVAYGCLGEEMIIDHSLVNEMNPDWLPDIEVYVKRLNQILHKENNS